jgi:uncharacterized membrane protein YphA (DoxX/SURF4 family)
VTILKWAVAAAFVLIGLGLLPIRDLGVSVAMPSASAHPVPTPWLLPVVRLAGGLCLVLGVLLAWRTYQSRSPRSGP